MKTKRIIAILLTVVMLVMLPVEIFAKSVDLNIVYDGRNISIESEDTDPSWTLNNLLPGQSDTSTVTVKNTGVGAVLLETGIIIEEDTGLLDKIDMTVTNKAGDVVYKGSYTDLRTIETQLAPNATETFTVVTSLNVNAGNEYQGKQYKLKFNFKATGTELLGTLTVRYVDQDGNDLETPTVETDYITEKYDYRNVTPKSFENRGYSYTGRVDGNLYDNYKVEGSEIVYHYVKNSSVKVKHIVDNEYEEDGTTKKVLKQFTDKKAVGSQYSYSSETFSGYEFNGTIDGDASGTVTEEQKEVVFHYTKKEIIRKGRVIILYVDENEDELDRTVTTKDVGEDYKYTEGEIAKDIPGFKYIKYEGELEGKYKEEDTVIFCRYESIKYGNLIVLCVDENNEVIKRTVTTREVGTDYDLGKVGEEIPGYDFIGVEGETSGKYVLGDTIVTYRYKHKKNGPSTDEIVKPRTGDSVVKYIAIALGAVGVLLILVFIIKKKKKDEE